MALEIPDRIEWEELDILSSYLAMGVRDGSLLELMREFDDYGEADAVRLRDKFGMLASAYFDGVEFVSYGDGDDE